jgi:hypothetical protein
MKLVKPIIASILAASVAGCLTEQLESRVTTPASPAAKYGASWYKTDYWTGEYPHGFATARNETVKIREAPQDAPKSVSCALGKGATYTAMPAMSSLGPNPGRANDDTQCPLPFEVAGTRRATTWCRICAAESQRRGEDFAGDFYS